MSAAPGYLEHKDDLLRRLRRIEGQVRGLERLVESETYCIDVLTQVAATTKALQSVAVQLLQEHLRHCVAAAATADQTAGSDGAALEHSLNEATKAVERLLRT